MKTDKKDKMEKTGMFVYSSSVLSVLSVSSTPVLSVLSVPFHPNPDKIIPL
jgi:hypothetical protein